MKTLLILTLSLITVVSVKSQIRIGTATPISTFQVSGSQSTSTVTITATHTASSSEYTILSNNTSGAITINLQAAAGCSGRIYNIKKLSGASKNVTIDPNASETIDGASTTVLSNQYDSVTIQSDGTNWFILSKN
ncbi:MAG: hypothetical protein ABUT20_08270 [Bacteroidota bacterium]